MDVQVTAIQWEDFSLTEKFSSDLVPSAFEIHMHNEYEMYYFLSGDAQYAVGGNMYCLQPHDLLFIRPSEYHRLQLQSAAPYRRIVMHFTPKQLHDLALRNIKSLHTHYRLPSESPVRMLLSCLLQAAKRTQKEDAFFLLQYINLILTELFFTESQTETAPLHIPSALHEILRYVDENLHRPISLQTVSQELFVSMSWLTHTFRQHMHMSFMHYVTRKKILLAHQWISDGMPSMQAAEKCGFESYSAFYTQYRKVFGHSPSRQ